MVIYIQKKKLCFFALLLNIEQYRLIFTVFWYMILMYKNTENGGEACLFLPAIPIKNIQ